MQLRLSGEVSGILGVFQNIFRLSFDVFHFHSFWWLSLIEPAGRTPGRTTEAQTRSKSIKADGSRASWMRGPQEIRYHPDTQ